MTLCPLCLAVNIVASDTGPTCSHTRGDDWWPENWDKMSDEARLEWLKEKNYRWIE